MDDMDSDVEIVEPPSKKRKVKGTAPQKVKKTDRSAVPKEEFISARKWTREEKKNLLKLLKKCVCEDDVTKVYHRIPSRTPKEVEAEILKLKLNAAEQGSEIQAPIESWLDFVQEMVHYEAEDHSKCLARAMSMVSNFDTFEELPGGMTPDYSLIYAYLAAALRNEQLPALPPLESYVLRLLMEDLSNVLGKLDTQDQRKVMTWKYSMLNCKVDIRNPKESWLRVNKALTNVFPDDLLTNKSKTKMSASTTLGESNRPSSSTSTPVNQSGTDGSSETRSLSSVQNGCRSPETEVKNGLFQVIGPPETTQTDEHKLAAGSSQDGSRNGNGSSQSTDPPTFKYRPETVDLTSANMDLPTQSTGTKNEDPPMKKWRRGRLKKGEERAAPPNIKPILFTLNPFCVPTNILKMNELPQRKNRKPKASSQTKICGAEAVQLLANYKPT